MVRQMPCKSNVLKKWSRKFLAQVVPSTQLTLIWRLLVSVSIYYAAGLMWLYHA